jgi:hypothetical protein
MNWFLISPTGMVALCFLLTCAGYGIGLFVMTAVTEKVSLSRAEDNLRHGSIFFVKKKDRHEAAPPR